MKRIPVLFLSLCLSIAPLAPLAAYAAAPGSCTAPLSSAAGNICIIEVQTVGLSGDEADDFVVLANPTASAVSLSSVQLQYFNSNGVADVSVPVSTSGSTSLGPGQTKVFVSDSLQETNPGAAKLTTSSVKMSLASGGGGLQVAKVLSSGTTVYDRVAWGTASTSVAEGAAVEAPSPGQAIVRQSVDGVFQDTALNTADFAIETIVCHGAAITEVQPFVTDEFGASIDAWVELAASSPDAPGDCMLLTGAGDAYTIPAADMPVGEIPVAINRALDAQGQSVPLHIGDRAGKVWITGISHYGEARIPAAMQSYTNVSKGQSWALVDGIWRRTYAPTPGDINMYVTNAPTANDDPTACEAVRITELAPNPTGDDAGKEWIELYNNSDTATRLGRCQIDIAGTLYSFLADDVLAPHEWRTVQGLYTTEGDDKVVSLRNSGDTLVSWGRSESDGSTTILQSFVYSDPPEGQSWARFDDGWYWTYAPTANAVNALQITPLVLSPTEFPAVAGLDSGSAEVTQSGTLASTSVVLTELLPNPVSPFTDEDDEYVELYNPGTQAVDLTGYKVQTGTSYSYSYTFDHVTLDPGEYRAWYARDTGLSLANSAGRARLLDARGNTLSETTAYDKALEGSAWALVSGVWQWTTSPTPSGANTLTHSPQFPTTNKTAAAKTAKASTSAKSSAKTAGATTSKTAKPKASATKTAKQTAASAPKNISKSAPLHTGVLAGIGGLTVAYGAYEYRHDLANHLYRFKRYRAARRENRS